MGEGALLQVDAVGPVPRHHLSAERRANVSRRNPSVGGAHTRTGAGPGPDQTRSPGDDPGDKLQGRRKLPSSSGQEDFLFAVITDD